VRTGRQRARKRQLATGSSIGLEFPIYLQQAGTMSREYHALIDLHRIAPVYWISPTSTRIMDVGWGGCPLGDHTAELRTPRAIRSRAAVAHARYGIRKPLK
jgi:hypothetical protein